MIKVSIIGKDSFIGRHLFDYLKNKNDITLSGTNKNELDITLKSNIETYVKGNSPDVIILFAGSKDVKKLEEDISFADKINVQPVKDFVDAIKKYSPATKFLYVSSDYVFDGKKGNYKESDTPCPNTVYGKNKIEVEDILKNSKIDYQIIRTAAVLGSGSVFLEWLLGELSNKNKVEMFENSFFSPTPVDFLCEIFYEIIKNPPKEKIIHAVGEKRLSRFELGKIIKNLIKSRAEIVPIEANFKDLSLSQSDFIKKNQTKSFEEYLHGILKK